MNYKRILLIINPRAGKMNFKNSFYNVMKTFSDAGCSVVTYFTRSVGDAAKKARKEKDDFDLIISCGGDGTLNETISGLAEKGKTVTIGYLPCGSTNDFAMTLGIPAKPADAVKQIVEDRFRTIDLGRFNDRFFTYTASFGAFTEASYGTPQNLKNSIGHLAYIINGAKQLTNIKAIPMKITADDYSEEGSFIYGGVSNTTSIGGVYSLPDDEVHLNDGRFEVLMIRKPPNPAAYMNMLLSFAARNYKDPSILFLHADKVVFESPTPVSYTLDGEFGGYQTRAEIECLKSACKVNGEEDK